jgi:hypothetical protein
VKLKLNNFIQVQNLYPFPPHEWETPTSITSRILARQGRYLIENFSIISYQNKGGVKFYTQSVLWVSAVRGTGKVLLNGAVSFQSSPVSAQRECYFRFPTIPWLGVFQHRVVCCELRRHAGHFVIYYELPTTSSNIYSWPLPLPHRLET